VVHYFNCHPALPVPHSALSDNSFNPFNSFNYFNSSNRTALPMDCLAVIRAPLEQFPPSMHQVNLLAESGLTVGVIDLAHPDYPSAPACSSAGKPPRVRRIRAGRHIQFYKEKKPSAPVRLLHAWHFRRCVRRTITAHRPALVIAYDPYAIHAVGKLCEYSAHTKLVWHFHEAFPPADPRRSATRSNPGLLTRAANAFCARWAPRPDEIIFPDTFRARLFLRAIGPALQRNLAVVYNCPRLLPAPPRGCLRQTLRAAGFSHQQPVLFFQGWIVPDRSLEQLIQAMSTCPQNPLLVLAGPVSPSYRSHLENVAASHAVQNRIFFPGLIACHALDSYAVDADLGLSLFPTNSTDPNLRYLAGASNKRFQYMAVGLPQISNPGDGMREIIQAPGVGLLVDPADQPALSHAISRLLANPDLRRQMSHRARQAHLGQFNYEHQFAPLRDKFIEWCGKPKHPINQVDQVDPL
jgi:glycosyltransferase involved in cell wall biosynthesis